MTEDTQCETMGIQATSHQPSPLHRVSTLLKRKPGSIEFADLGDLAEPKKICIEVVCSSETTPTAVQKGDNKENELKVQKEVSAPVSHQVPSQKSPAEVLLTNRSTPAAHQVVPSPTTYENGVSKGSGSSTLDDVIPGGGQSEDDVYDDSGLSDDDTSEDESTECEDDDDEDENVCPSPLFEPVLRGTPCKPVITPTPPTPKSLYSNDRFWPQNGFQMNSSPQQSNGMSSPSHPPNGHIPFNFLESTSNQRIECAENGKSYLQLGTMNHHHLPVTPVIQPKPNMVYRRPIQPYKPAVVSSPSPRQVCDHNSCVVKRSSHCYKSIRSRVLNVSLHKLHIARQSHEGCLRRSVLICNMLRYIEEETEKEMLQESQHFASLPPPPPPQLENDVYWSPPISPQQGHQLQNQISAEDCSQQHYMSSSPSSMGAPFGLVSSCGNANCPGNSQECSMAGSSGNVNSLSDTYEMTLKDFNSAFRSTPYSSPAHPGLEVDSGLGNAEEERGINWGSVLSLSSQSELDPLNNNSFGVDGWQSSQSTSLCGSVGESMDQTGYEDIGWKLTGDDVLKSFTDDGIYGVVTQAGSC